MAYVTTNPPRLITQAIAGMRMWHYTSTDAQGTGAGTVRFAGYFTNGYQLGMRVGDLVIVTDSDSATQAISLHSVITANATTGACDLSDALATPATANSD